MEQRNVHIPGISHTVNVRINWLSLEKRRDYLSRCQTYKIINKLDCLSVNNFIPQTSILQDRTNMPYFVYISMLELTVIDVLFLCFLWNSLPIVLLYVVVLSIVLKYRSNHAHLIP